MEFKLSFDHYNINVANREKSIEFYKKALGLHEVGWINDPDGNFTITYMGDGITDFRLEITCLRNHPQAYNLGENETHLALRLQPNNSYEEMLAYHKELGVVCFENPTMGVYFIEDPDGYWIEILKPKEK